MTTTLTHRLGTVEVEERPGDRRFIRVRLSDPSMFIPRDSWETAYSLDLIQRVLEMKGPAYLCDEIMRDESPDYVRRRLERSMLAFVSEESFVGKRLLDFGCGAAASTVILAKLFPQTEIVGVELNEKLLSLAHARAEFYGFDHLTFHRSPSGVELPANIGRFDFIVMNAVYEHLLPGERRAILPLLWSTLNPGGVLFINETPNRLWHREAHTTGLLFINYLPDKFAFALIRRFSNRYQGSDWRTLLRDGVRGGTEREVLRMLRDGGAQPRALTPTRLGCRDRIDVAFSMPGTSEPLSLKRRSVRAALKSIRAITGLTYHPNLILAIQNVDDG